MAGMSPAISEPPASDLLHYGSNHHTVAVYSKVVSGVNFTTTIACVGNIFGVGFLFSFEKFTHIYKM